MSATDETRPPAAAAPAAPQAPPAAVIGGVPYEAVIGIECHVELKTETKMFCGCRNVFGGEPNTNVCPVCLGMPGALPVPNRRAIELLVLAGLAFDAEIPAYSKFDRKNYFYPDMPKDYQISQFDTPLTQGGVVRYLLPDGTAGSCRLTRIHLEEDTGKSTHASRDGRIAGSTHSLVDFNRAGVPLMECVGEPDIRTGAQAVAFLEALKRAFVALGVSDVKMEEGSLRCDVNLSLRPVGATEYGTKTETKNMNSFRSVARAVEAETARQAALLAAGERVVQETRGWDEARGVSHSMRSKEEAHDYRYFPDPDLSPIEYAPADVERLRSELWRDDAPTSAGAAGSASAAARSPQARLEHYVRELGLPPSQAAQIVDAPGLDAYVARAIALGGAPKQVVNLVLGDLARLANESGTPVAASRVTPAVLGELASLVEAGTINSKTVKDLLERYWSGAAGDASPRALVASEGLGQVSDPGAVDAIVAAVLAEQQKSVADYRAGKTKVMGFLVGQVMRRSGGKANPALAEERLRASLDAAV